MLVHRTKASGLRMAAAMDHIDRGPGRAPRRRSSAFADLARIDGRRRPRARQAAADRQVARLRLVGDALGAGAARPGRRPRWPARQHTGWDGLLAEQRAYLDDFWDRADVEIEGDAELQQAVRFALFHTLQAGARGEQRAIAAKGLTGPGYDGHTFWDTEMFVLPVLTYTAPHAAADALRWRQQTLDLARERARDLGLKGAAFPWRTIDGRGVLGLLAGRAPPRSTSTPTSPTRSTRYQWAADDPDFEREAGAELLVETARLWRSLGHHDAAGQFRIDGVTGPDEYSAIADNNVYTNLMAQRNLRAAADVVERHPKRAARARGRRRGGRRLARRRREDDDPLRRAARGPPAGRGVHRARRSGTSTTAAPDQYPLLLHFPYFDLYRKQVVKQADLVLALHVCGDAFTDAREGPRLRLLRAR